MAVGFFAFVGLLAIALIFLAGAALLCLALWFTKFEVCAQNDGKFVVGGSLLVVFGFVVNNSVQASAAVHWAPSAVLFFLALPFLLVETYYGIRWVEVVRSHRRRKRSLSETPS